MKKWYNNIEEGIGSVLLLFMTLLTVANVVSRYILHASIAASEEIATLLFVLVSLLGAAVAVKRKAHLGLTVLTERMSPRLYRRVTIFGYACGVIFCMFLVVYGARMVWNEYTYKILTISMNWPEWIFGLFVPVGGMFIGIRFLQMIYIETKTKDTEIDTKDTEIKTKDTKEEAGE